MSDVLQPASESPRILVVKLGALGDVVQATGPFVAIRRHHPQATITLLTTEPFGELAKDGGWFDDVWIDRKPAMLDVSGSLALRRRLRDGGFQRVYDLQTSDRSSLYFRLFWPGPYPEWSGIARGCSHPHANPARDRMHTIDRHIEQLRAAGIGAVPPPDMSWSGADIAALGITQPFALLMPGGARHRLDKRWPVARFSGLGRRLASRGVRPVLIGTKAEAEVMGQIASAVPEALDLMDRTSFLQIAVLAREASVAVGNDTGPMQIAAATGCPSVVLFSMQSDPALCAPRGRVVKILRRPTLHTLSIDEVWGAVRPALP
ncbi:MAG: glycosyltransferase family 9 protein [Proteobacteria bacterium]|nr:glycosyltransferase family 9 protein [Pseudomonadota bacterium]